MAGVMEKSTVHTFLNKRHKTLEPEFSAAVKSIREEGLIEKFIREASQTPQPYSS